MEADVVASPLGSDHAAGSAGRSKNPRYRAARLRFEVAEKVARLLIGYRQRHGLTQAQLAKALGMKESALSRLESGEHVPNFETLARVADGCNAEVVLDFAERADTQLGNTREMVPA